jgi:hypothetical protein
MHVPAACLIIAFISASFLLPPASRESERLQGAAQTAQSNLPPPFVVPPHSLPQGENAWVIHLLSRGGFIGTGRGDITVTSEGRLMSSGVEGRCTQTLTRDSVDALQTLVLSATTLIDSNGPKLSGVCIDCYMTAIVLQRREAGGVERMYTAAWDDATEPLLSPDLMKLYEALIALKGCKR